MKKVLTFLFILLSVNLIIAPYGYDDENLPQLQRDTSITPFTNSTVANSSTYADFWDGLNTPSDINVGDLGDGASYSTTSALQSIFLNLSGTNANQNINISHYNFTTSGKITTTLFKAGTINIKDANLSADGGEIETSSNWKHTNSYIWIDSVTSDEVFWGSAKDTFIRIYPTGSPASWQFYSYNNPVEFISSYGYQFLYGNVVMDKNLSVDDNIVAGKNITADWFKGKINYSDVQNHPAGGNSSWNESLADSLYIRNDTDGGYKAILKNLNVSDDIMLGKINYSTNGSDNIINVNDKSLAFTNINNPTEPIWINMEHDNIDGGFAHRLYINGTIGMRATMNPSNIYVFSLYDVNKAWLGGLMYSTASSNSFQIINNQNNADIQFKVKNGAGSTKYMFLDGSAERLDFYTVGAKIRDDMPFYFGTGDDWDLTFNQSDLVLDRNVGGDFIVDGNQVITGNLTVSGNLTANNINVAGCIVYNGGTLGTCV